MPLSAHCSLPVNANTHFFSYCLISLLFVLIVMITEDWEDAADDWEEADVSDMVATLKVLPLSYSNIQLQLCFCHEQHQYCYYSKVLVAQLMSSVRVLLCAVP
jgi:hypothetical protein